MTDIGIAGGGIGGLCAALALADRHRVTVLERAARFEPVGAGLILGPNAVRALASLGVDAAPAGRIISAMDIRRADDHVLQRLPVAAVAPRLGPTVAITRTVLHQLLIDALADRAEIRLSSTVGPFQSTGADPAEQAGVDLLIGADGIRSAVRAAIDPSVPLRYSGTTCWRGIAPDPGLDAPIEVWGVGTRIGVVPLIDGQAYYFLVADAPAGDPGPADIAQLQQRFAGYAGPAGRLIESLTELPPAHHDLHELDRPVWGHGSTILLGDAAHAMTPNLGQGAAMAIEDAVVLGREIAAGPDGLLERYRGARHDRVRWVQLTARRLGRIAHLGARPARGLRDLAVRATPDRVGLAQFERIASGV